MRIVTLINGLNNGGAEKFAVELCNELCEKHEVYLLVKQPITDDMIPPRKLCKKVKLIEFNSSVKWDFLFLLRLFFAVIRIKPHVIHLHSSLLIFFTFFYPVFFRTSRVFHTIHNQITPAYLKVLKFVNVLQKCRVRMVQIVISEKIKKDYEAQFPDIRFFVIENGVKGLNMSRNIVDDNMNRPKHLLAIGHFGPAKRFDALVDVLALPEISHRFTLEIIGEEKQSSKPVTCYILARSLENVKLLGLKENPAEYLCKADALVIWSSFEGMPLVMLEALSVGCPIISSPVGGIADVIVSGENGILTKGLDQKDLMEALYRFDELSFEDLKSISIKNSLLFKSRFSIQICAENYEKLFALKS
jgi:glycosyltransferase involved in cell wall biosynthesis